MTYLILPLVMVLLASCSSSDQTPPSSRSSSPYVDALRDARSVGAASEDATRAREAEIKAAQP